jgi:hypothetical protein
MSYFKLTHYQKRYVGFRWRQLRSANNMPNRASSIAMDLER